MRLLIATKNFIQEHNLVGEILLRAILVLTFIILEQREPFYRVIHKEEAWLYFNPRTDSYVPTSILWPMVVLVPGASIGFVYLITRKIPDLLAGALAFSLAHGLNGVFTDVIKLSVGRPRPDFIFRCWPDGVIPPDALGKAELNCTGDFATVIEGRKSFPSGHSSFSFATFGFVFFYASAKLKTFCGSSKGTNGSSVRIVLPLLLLLIPTLIAISRTCDYHHHWQDVTVGSILGFFLSWVSYRFYYPPLSSLHCDRPYAAQAKPYYGNQVLIQ